jgi:hypothetical protein
MTGYYLSVGYNSAVGADLVAAELIAAVEKFRDRPDLIDAEILRVGEQIPESVDFPAHLAEFANRQSACLRVDTYPGAPSQVTVCLSASGGGPDRKVKETTRRAFCRLVIAHMHARGMEINMSVG